MSRLLLLSVVACAAGWVWADRLVPVDPLLDEVNADRAILRFFDDRDGTFFIRDYGQLTEGVQTISVDRNGLTNTYTITAQRKRSWPEGRRLNNFVTEMLREPVREGAFSFVNPRDGWVSIAVEGCDRALVRLGGRTVVEPRADEPLETLRELKSGTHSLHVSGVAGTGQLVVRLVNPTKITARTIAGETNISRGRPGYGWEFYRRWMLPAFAEFTMGDAWRLHPDEYVQSNPDLARRIAFGNGELLKRGRRLRAATDVRPFGKDELRADYVKMRDYLCGAKAYQDGLALELDEHQINAGKDKMDAFAEATWEMVAERRPLPLLCDFCDLPGCGNVTNYLGQASTISAVLNTGLGHGMLVPEMYLGAKPSRSEMLRQEELALSYIDSLRALMPAAPSHVVHLMSGWLTVGEWSSYSSCEVDIKALYDHYIHRLATDPRCADVGSVGMSTLACDEETARWTARLIHHYCIEGHTNSLAAQFGFAYRPEIVKDGDFMRGLEAWVVSAAEPGAITSVRRPGYGGKRGQCRMARQSTEQGEHAAVLKRSEKGPNRLSQQVAGLTPGKYYALTYALADLDDVEKPGSVVVDDGLAAHISCGDEVRELRYETRVPDAKGLARAKKAKRPPHATTIVRKIVFLATAATGELVIDDARSARGRRHLVNYVSINPYYLESEAELAVLKSLATCSE